MPMGGKGGGWGGREQVCRGHEGVHRQDAQGGRRVNHDEVEVRPDGGQGVLQAEGRVELTDHHLLETLERVRARPNPDLQLLGVVVTMYDPRTNIAKDSFNHIKQVFGDKLLRTQISRSVRLEESPAYKESILTFAPKSPGAQEYLKLSREVLERVEANRLAPHR